MKGLYSPRYVKIVRHRVRSSQCCLNARARIDAIGTNLMAAFSRHGRSRRDAGQTGFGRLLPEVNAGS